MQPSPILHYIGNAGLAIPTLAATSELNSFPRMLQNGLRLPCQMSSVPHNGITEVPALIAVWPGMQGKVAERSTE